MIPSQLELNSLAVVGGLSGFMVFIGFMILKEIRGSSALQAYLLQIIGLSFILPVLLVMSVVLKIQNEAVVGIIGTIVGYIFGASQKYPEQNKNKNNDNSPVVSSEESKKD